MNFYQTLAKGSAPYVIETSTIDPFNQTLSNPQGLSEGTIDSGTYVASGETVNIVSAAPVETAGHYTVAASAPGYSDGPLTTTVGPPKSGTALVPLPGLSLASGASPGSVVAVVTPASATRYDHGQLLVSHEGTLVASVPLDTVLTQGGGTVAATSPPVRPPPTTTFRFGSGTAVTRPAPCRGSRFRRCSTCAPAAARPCPSRSTERRLKISTLAVLRP